MKFESKTAKASVAEEIPFCEFSRAGLYRKSVLARSSAGGEPEPVAVVEFFGPAEPRQ